MCLQFRDEQAEVLNEVLNVGGVDLRRELGIQAKEKDLKDFVKPWLFLPTFLATVLKHEYGAQAVYHQVRFVTWPVGGREAC
jgi:hypothetical protein